MNYPLLAALSVSNGHEFFRFQTIDQFNFEYEKNTTLGADIKIIMIDGDDLQTEFAGLFDIELDKLENWIENCMTYCFLSTENRVAVNYLADDLRWDMDRIFSDQTWKQVSVFRGMADDYAYEEHYRYIADQIGDTLAIYFNWSKLADDLVINGDIKQIVYADNYYTITNNSDI